MRLFFIISFFPSAIQAFDATWAWNNTLELTSSKKVTLAGLSKTTCQLQKAKVKERFKKERFKKKR